MWKRKGREEERFLKQAQNWKGASRKQGMKFQLASSDWSQLHLLLELAVARAYTLHIPFSSVPGVTQPRVNQAWSLGEFKDFFFHICKFLSK